MEASELRADFAGAILEPDDGGYEDARQIFNWVKIGDPIFVYV